MRRTEGRQWRDVHGRGSCCRSRTSRPNQGHDGVGCEKVKEEKEMEKGPKARGSQRIDYHLQQKEKQDE